MTMTTTTILVIAICLLAIHATYLHCCLRIATTALNRVATNLEIELKKELEAPTFSLSDTKAEASKLAQDRMAAVQNSMRYAIASDPETGLKTLTIYNGANSIDLSLSEEIVEFLEECRADSLSPGAPIIGNVQTPAGTAGRVSARAAVSE